MKNYIVHNIDGEILKTGQCQDSDLFFQGEYVIEGVANDAKQYIKNGKIINIPASPNPYFVFNYQTKTWVDPRTPETQWPIVRQERDQLLQASDYTQLPDVPLTDKAAWATYRQELRDVTTQTDPFNIVWPVVPQS